MIKPLKKGPARDPFLAFTTDSATREALGEVAGRQKWSPAAVQKGGITEAIATLLRMPSPQHLVVDLDGVENPLEAVNHLAEVCDPGTVVVALGTVNDIVLYRSLVEAGVVDYLLKPVGAEMLEHALFQPLDDGDGDSADDGRAEITFVIGARGGVGASTLAVNAAWLIANEQKKRVALVDLDLQFGSASLALDLEPGRGLREALQNPGRIDGLFLERTLVKVSDTLAVLGAEEGIDQDTLFDSHALELLFGELSGTSKHIVADMPRSLVALHREAFALARRVVIVTDLSLIGLRDSVRLRRFVREAAPDAKVAVVANRVGPKTAMNKSEFERGLDASLDGVVPDDPKSFMAALTAGKPLAQTAANTKVVGEMRTLAAWITGARETLKSESIWKRLMAKK